MSIRIQFRGIENFELSQARQAAVNAALRPNIDYSDEAEVNAARKAITHMGTWDRLWDSYFAGNRKQEILNAIADKVLCDEAARWKEEQSGPGGERKAITAGYGSRDRLAAHAKFVQLLSPQGLQTLLVNPNVQGSSVTFWPRTENKYADYFLSITVEPPEAAAQLLRRADVRNLPDAAKIYRGIAQQQAAQSHQTTELKPRFIFLMAAARDYEKEARMWSMANHSEQKQAAWADAISCYEACCKLLPNDGDAYRAEALRNLAYLQILMGNQDSHEYPKQEQAPGDDIQQGSQVSTFRQYV